jgi:phage terminase small subunit
MFKYWTIDEDKDTIPTEWVLERLRLQRDELLKASDWTQVADAVCDKQAWAIYRQALRDLPSSVADPRDAEFPTKP